MPVYNGERFLAAAARSVLVQSFGDFELIVVNDGSTDRTATVLQALCEEDRRIRVINQPTNAGIAAALNVGCRAATGEVIARMDADDITLPERFGRQIEFLNENPDIGLLGATVQTMDEEGRLGRIWPSPTSPGGVAWGLMFSTCVAHPTIMVRRRVLEQVGYYPLGYVVEDYALLIRAIRVTRIANLPTVLHHYRIWNESFTQVQVAKNRHERGFARVLLESVDALADVGGTEADVKLIRGLARHEYPGSTVDIVRTHRLLQALRGFVSGLAPLRREDVREIELDVGVRLWLLAALALKARSPQLSWSLALEAIKASPGSAMVFAKKSVRRVTGGRR